MQFEVISGAAYGAALQGAPAEQCSSPGRGLAGVVTFWVLLVSPKPPSLPRSWGAMEVNGPAHLITAARSKASQR